MDHCGSCSLKSVHSFNANNLKIKCKSDFSVKQQKNHSDPFYSWIHDAAVGGPQQLGGRRRRQTDQLQARRAELPQQMNSFIRTPRTTADVSV